MSHFKGMTPRQEGYTVKNGRLINLAPDGMTGIARASSMKRAVKNDRKVNQIAEAIEMAENKKNFRQLYL